MGVPLFQEQLMQMAMAVGGIDGDEADLLRRAMGSKRGIEKISSLKQQAVRRDGRATGSPATPADEIYDKIEAFANFGFAESHSISFALLVYSSTWLRLHYPAAFLAALLRAQPMGFYSPQSLVADARRHGVEVRRPDLQLLRGRRRARAPGRRPGAHRRRPGSTGCLGDPQPPVGPFDPKRAVRHHRPSPRRRVRGPARAGRGEDDRGQGRRADRRGARARTGRTPTWPTWSAVPGSPRAQVEALATAGAFDCFGLDRRQALWEAGRAAEERPGQLAGVTAAGPPPMLPGMTDIETDMADLWSTGITTDQPPDRSTSATNSAPKASCPPTELREAADGTRVRVAGVVTHRQRPATASGVTFMNLEDETGMVNIVITVGCFIRNKRTIISSAALIISGRVERSQGVTNLAAEKIERLPIAMRSASRDWR